MPHAIDPFSLPPVDLVQVESTPVDQEEALQGFPSGSQNVGLYRFSCSLRAKGTKYSVAEVLVKTAADRCTPYPYPEADSGEGPGWRSIIDRAFKTYPDGAVAAKAELEAAYSYLETNTIGFSEFAKTPEPKPRSYVIDGLIPEHCISTIFGSGGEGKGQPVRSKVYTPLGLTTIGDLDIGSTVLDPDGGTATVLKIHELGYREIFRISFSDNTVVDTTDDHLWSVYDSNKQCFLTTKQLAKKTSKQLTYITVPALKKADFTPTDIPLDPYVLGALLGDGSFGHVVSFTNLDQFIVDKIIALLPASDKLRTYGDQLHHCVQSKTYRTRSKTKIIADALNLTKTNHATKFIPNMYKYNSASVRLSVLQGLFDTDGTVTSAGQPMIEQTSKQLAADIEELAQTLGWYARTKTYRAVFNGKDYGEKYNTLIFCPTPEKLFTLPRKSIRTKPRKRHNTKYRRLIRSIQPLDLIEKARCIELDSANQLYITEGGIVTHNSYLSLYLAINVRNGTPFFMHNTTPGNVLYVDAELDQDEMTRRAFAVSRGLGLQTPPPGVFYHRLSGNIIKNVDALKKFIRDNNIKLTILDSLTIALLDADVNSHAVIIPSMKMLEELGTVLAIDHTAKRQQIPGFSVDNMTQFGSAFKTNLGRSVIHLIKHPGSITLKHEKHNFGKLLNPLEYQMREEEDCIKFVVVELPKEMQAIIAKLTDGPLTAQELVQLTGIAQDALIPMLYDAQKRGLVRPTDGAWELVPQKQQTSATQDIIKFMREVGHPIRIGDYCKIHPELDRNAADQRFSKAVRDTLIHKLDRGLYWFEPTPPDMDRDIASALTDTDISHLI